MSSHQNRRDEVEEILALVPGAAEADALVALFSCAAGPVVTGELDGEAAAIAAFLAAQPVVGPSRRAKFRATVFTVKAAVAALAVTSVGGVALAATTEVLPAPLTIGSHSGDSSPGKKGGSSGDAVENASNAADVRDAAKTAAAADRADAKAGRENSASYNGLCKAFTAGAWDNARAAGNPAFSRLVAAAPQGNVAAFCTALATEAPADKTPGGKTPTDKTPGGNAKSPTAGDKAAGNDRSADAREKAGNNGKTAATPKDPKADPPRGNDKTDDAQRVQRSR